MKVLEERWTISSTQNFFVKTMLRYLHRPKQSDGGKIMINTGEKSSTEEQFYIFRPKTSGTGNDAGNIALEAGNSINLRKEYRVDISFPRGWRKHQIQGS